MTFATYEESQEGSKPIEVYTITIGTVVYRWTSSEDNITVGSNVFTSIGISRDKLQGGGPDQRDKVVSLTVNGTNPLAIRYISSVPGQRATVQIQRVQRTDGPSYEVIAIFEGQISSVSFDEGGRKAKIRVEPILSATSRIIPRTKYSSVCNNVVYDSRCQVSDTDAAYLLSSANVTAEVGRTITVTGAGLKADGFYTAGLVTNENGTDQRLIIDHVGDLLTLHITFAESVLGTSVDVLAGCDHSIATCKTKFNNVKNFRGFAFVPTKNIFESGLIN